MKNFQIDMHDVSIEMQKHLRWSFVHFKRHICISIYSQCISFEVLCSPIHFLAYHLSKLARTSCFK